MEKVEGNANQRGNTYQWRLLVRIGRFGQLRHSSVDGKSARWWAVRVWACGLAAYQTRSWWSPALPSSSAAAISGFVNVVFGAVLILVVLLAEFCYVYVLCQRHLRIEREVDIILGLPSARQAAGAAALPLVGAYRSDDTHACLEHLPSGLLQGSRVQTLKRWPLSVDFDLSDALVGL